jgi:hypothetical protein
MPCSISFFFFFLLPSFLLASLHIRSNVRTEKTGIAPEFITFRSGSDFAAGSNAPFYILRPETVESLFILFQLTGDPIYLEWGCEIFQAIEHHCRTDAAYGGISDVRDANVKPNDRMESFFLAETLKYLYLLFDNENEIDARIC